MPTLADYQAAIPLCAGPPTQAGFSVSPCNRPMTWNHVRDVWVCPEHGDRWNVRAELVAVVKSMEQRQEVIG